MSIGVEGGADLVYKKQGVCVDRWLEPNTCIESVGIICPLLVGCVVPRAGSYV